MDSPAPLRRRYAMRHVAARAGVYFAAIVAALVCAGPFPWSLAAAFKQNRDLQDPQNNPFVFNQPATSDHVNYRFTDTAFPTFVWNTAWVGGLVVLITLVLALPIAYALARLDRPWSGPVGIAILLVYLVPPSLSLRCPGWASRWGCRSPRGPWCSCIPRSRFWLALMDLFKDIPQDIEEQAMVDGYSRLGAFVRAGVPLVFPGIVALVAFAFTLTASEFIYALAFVAPTAQMPVSTGVSTQFRGDVFFWQSLRAATVLVAVPMALVFNWFLDRFVAGFTMGAIKE
jgi:multiple sugar transport system permease protein